MILQIDLGNSRLKWRLKFKGASLAEGAHWVKDGWESFELALMQHWENVREIQVASVQSEAKNQELRTILAGHSSLAPRFATSQSQCGLVINGYEQSGSLGVDRWLGMVASFNRYKRACLVVSAGTATTVDLVLGDGRHLGGYIAPGFAMFVQSLGQNTARVNVAGGRVEYAPGQSTQAAVLAAYGAMLEGLMAQAQREFAERSQMFSLIVAGGDAAIVLKRFPEAILYSDMVLDGLDCMFATSKPN